MSPFKLILCSAAALLATASTSSADLTRDGDIGFVVKPSIGADVIQTGEGDFDYAFDDTTNTLNLVGDQSLRVRPGQADSLRASVFVPFASLGTFPEEATFDINHDYKVVNSGGSIIGEASVKVRGVVAVYERGNYDAVDPSTSDLGPILNGFGYTTEQDENGYTLVDHEDALSWILVPGESYVGVVSFIIDVNGALLSQLDPIAAGTLEAGAVSGFDGLTAQFNSVPVPEPASMLGLCEMAGLLLRRR